MDGSSENRKSFSITTTDHDFLASLNSVEEQIYQSGFEEGLHLEKEASKLDGWKAGLAKGGNLGLELGNYQGFCLAALLYLQSNPTGINPEEVSKLTKQVEKVQAAIQEFPTYNIKDQNIDLLSSQIKGQIAVLKSSLKIIPQTTKICGQKYAF